MKKEQDDLKVLRKLHSAPELSQRKIAEDLGFSLGKLNYCLKALNQKGYIKMKNFKKNPNKLNYAYFLTPKGMSEKIRLRGSTAAAPLLLVLVLSPLRCRPIADCLKPALERKVRCFD